MTDAAEKPSLLRVCRIGRAQGLKGEVNVISYTDDPETRFSEGSVLVTKDGHEFRPARFRQFKQRVIVTFHGVADRTAAEKLNGTTLYIPRQQAEDELAADRAQTGSDDNPDNPDEVYASDLVGLTAQAPDSTYLGKVTDVIESAQDLLQITEPHGAVSLVPFVTPLVPQIDLAHHIVVIDPPQGLLSEYPARTNTQHSTNTNH
jgi:16S rRNA processing protein RimM